ncbi:hypothetical protein GCM10027411_13250 [Microbacterium aureliae]
MSTRTPPSPIVPFLARDLPPRLNQLTYEFNRFTAVAYGGAAIRQEDGTGEAVRVLERIGAGVTAPRGTPR